MNGSLGTLLPSSVPSSLSSAATSPEDERRCALFSAGGASYLTGRTHPAMVRHPPPQPTGYPSQTARSAQMFTLELLGTAALRDEPRTVPVAAQQKRPLGLLAILGLGGKPGLSRDRI